jgi:integrase
VLTKLEGHTLFPIVAVALGTGLRRGELLGLQWGDIDLDAATLRVERSVEETKVGLRLKAPKTRRGRRNIKLPADAVAVLRDHKVQQLDIRLALGMGKPDATTLVFSDVEGELLKPHTISRAWRRVVASKKLPAVTFHALRHTHASMLIREWTFSRSAAASATARQPSPWTYTAT